MPTLVLKFKNSMVDEYRFEKGANLRIGRYKSNDVVIDNLAVSGRHAKIESVDAGFMLVDLQSKNGTFVNEKIITSHRLKHNDVISIGKHTLIFAYDDEEEETSEALEEIDESFFVVYGDGGRKKDVMESDIDGTMLLDTNRYRNLLEKNAPKRAESTAVLSVLSGEGIEFPLTKRVTRIGKAAYSDIIVRGFLVGRLAATVSKLPRGYYLNFMGGFIKPKVNGTPVKESILLKDGDALKIGSALMRFFYRC